ncbi:type IV pilus assembly protein FimV [Cupriavidus gilardii]|uniref:type IV pilus assembly protein FimV n=1 Tax=Cupriavidus gilardii TaxID=82541 RepID=UPI0007E4B74A|nr:FimV/HubP family polar landmark protein [Cupriavidus gilardii]
MLLSQALPPSAAEAASLGSLQVRSAQGQPLQAEIELRDVAAGEAEGLTLALASPQAYAAAGLTYPAGAEWLQIQLARNADGRHVARLRSAQPVGGNFIDLLLELRGPGGATGAAGTTATTTRAYTVLLAAPPADPAIAAQPDAGTTPLVQAATPEPAAPAVAPPAQPPAAAAAGSAMKPATKPAAKPATKSPGMAGGSYTVRRGDHLYGIARELVQQRDAVSLDQMVVALYRANRDAFIAGNMNRLKAGAVLSLPSAQQSGSIAGPEARREIVAHTRAFDAYRNRLADAAAAMQVQPQSGQQQRGQITARVRDAAVPEQARDELRLSKPEAGAVAPNGESAEAKLARERQLREAEERLTQLRKNVGDMQRLLEMKSAELARLGQDGKPEQPGQGASAPAAPATVAPGTRHSAAAPAASASASGAASAPTSPLHASASWFDTLLQSPWTLPGGGIALALLGGYALYRRQRRPLAAEPGEPGAPTAGADILAGAPIALTGLSLPLDAFPAPTGDQPIAAPASAAQAFADLPVEADDGKDIGADEPHTPRTTAPAPRPLAFDLGGISLDFDGGDAGNRSAEGSPDIMAPPDTSSDTSSDTSPGTPPRS